MAHLRGDFILSHFPKYWYTVFLLEILFLVSYLFASTEAKGAIVNSDIPFEPLSPVSETVKCPSMRCTPDRCSSGGSFNVADNFSELRACDCHPGCYTFGTCCDNYEKVCLPPMPNKGTDIHRMRSDLNVVNCEPIFVDSSKRRLYLLIVTQCPRPLLGHISVEDVGLCEERGARLDQDILIIHDSLLYMNIHCLRCNGRAIGDAESIPVNFVCENFGMHSVPHIRTLNESEMMEVYANGICQLSYDVDSFSIDHMCYSNYIDKCDSKFERKLSNYNQVNEACQSYSSYVALNTSRPILVSFYKNPHCALCNTPSHTDASCIDTSETSFESFAPGSRSNYKETFSLLLDFRGRIVSKSTLLTNCRNGKNSSVSFINAETNKCLTKLCPSGYRLLDEMVCIREEGYSFRTLHPERSFGYGDHYNIKLMFHYENELDLDYIQRKVYTSFYGLKIFFASESVYNCTSLDITPSLSCIEVTFTGYNFVEDLFLLTSSSFHDNLNSLDKDLSINQVRINLPANNACKDNCSLYHTADFVLTTNDVDEKNYIVSEEDVRRGNFYSLLVYLPEFDSILPLQQLDFEIYISKFGSGRWVVERKVGFDTLSYFNCSRGEGTCVPVSLQPRIHSLVTASGLKVEAILTKSCNIISVIALFLSLISRYFGPTATFPIVVQICIQVCLLFAHLIFLLSSSFSFPYVLCVASASLQHFFWIASFVFMNILSQILYKTFKSLSTRVNEGWAASAKIAYLGFGWGIPLLIACVCCVLHFLGYFTYAENGVCWIHGQLNLIIAFGSPVGALIVVNIVLFVLTALKLKEATNTSTVSRNASPTVSSFRFRFYLHLRLFSIMGSTWIFGFLSNIAQFKALSYLFVSLASLNGLFISLAFSLTKSQMQMIRDRFSSIFTSSRPASQVQDNNIMKSPAAASLT